MLRVHDYSEVTRFDLARTLAGRGRYWTSAYLVDDVLIDSGCAHTTRELLERLAPGRVGTILNTHTHEDHIGANGSLQHRDPGISIRVHPAGLPVLSDPRSRQPLQPYQRVMWGWPSASRGSPVDDGDVIETPSFRFQAVYTPGHSNDHLSYWEPNRGWLFTGDLFVGGRERALRADYDIWGIIDSLKRIARLDVTIMFPGSARVRHEPGREIQRKIDYLEELGGQIIDQHRQGRTVRQIVKTLLGPPLLLETITLGHFSRAALVRSCLKRENSTATDERS
jgi:glyoxylase-like metal-dependent hydrolase (beta-lactamase superfamily II)